MNLICGVVGSKEEQRGRDPETMRVQLAMPFCEIRKLWCLIQSGTPKTTKGYGN